MYKLLPKPFRLNEIDKGQTDFKTLYFEHFDIVSGLGKEIIGQKFLNAKGLHIVYNEKQAGSLYVKVSLKKDQKFLDKDIHKYQKKEGYKISIKDTVEISCVDNKGFLNALSILKQLISKKDDTFSFPHVEIYDYPNIEVRSISTTFAWYAGYSRVGFDSQLWDYEGWKEFIDICSDLKINQVNMCMYGYWPFRFEEFPETTLSNYPMNVWNKENKTWIEILYTHPNIVNVFLPDLINYAHERFIKIFAYIGLNSYNGGYSNIYKDRRAVTPEDRYYNNFDFLCLSDERNIDYLKKSIRKIVEIGLDGIIFEESEENYWYCSCERCKQKYLSRVSKPSDAKHLANYDLLKILHGVIKETNSHCEVGLRAWREEPFEKEVVYLEKARDSIPQDVYLYWAPGPYNPESEFEKWVKIFGPHRICARDQEGNAYSASMGRLFYMFKSNILCPEKEHLYWSIEKDIDQYIGAVRNKCRGINGYIFEYYAYFMHLFAAAQYGWNADFREEEFYQYALESVFGENLATDILYVYRNMKLIHETQLAICTLFFPFMRYKISTQDTELLQRIKKENKKILNTIHSIIDSVKKDHSLAHYVLHFEKLKNMALRSDVILDMCFTSIKYEAAHDADEKIKILQELSELNEKDFEIIKAMYFDINPHDKSGVKVCGFPYHELKRTINNLLNPQKAYPQMIYLGTETIGWMWI